jgi:uncharacterized protein
MKLLDDLLTTLDMQAEIKDIRLGMFHTAVLTRNCGLAASLPYDALKQAQEKQPPVREPGTFNENGVENLVKLAYSESILEAAVGMAAINSLLEIDTASCIQKNAGDLIAEKGEGKSIAIIGHFPFIPELRKIASEVWVIEKNPQEGDLTEDNSINYIPRADVVGITGTSITNHTIEGLIELCDPDAYVVLLGDTAPLSPVLFDYGIDAVSGTRVVDVGKVLQCVSQGATYRQIKGIEKLIMLRE